MSANNESMNNYQQAYEQLFAQLTPATQAKVLEAKGSEKEAPPEVVAFIKRVIDEAEKNEKKS